MAERGVSMRSSTKKNAGNNRASSLDLRLLTMEGFLQARLLIELIYFISYVIATYSYRSRYL